MWKSSDSGCGRNLSSASKFLISRTFGTYSLRSVAASQNRGTSSQRQRISGASQCSIRNTALYKNIPKYLLPGFRFRCFFEKWNQMSNPPFYRNSPCASICGNCGRAAASKKRTPILPSSSTLLLRAFPSWCLLCLSVVTSRPLPDCHYFPFCRMKERPLSYCLMLGI